MSLLSTISEASIRGYVGFDVGSGFIANQIIFESPTVANNYFGNCVDISIDGSYLAITTLPFYTSNFPTPAGSCYIYLNTGNSFTQQQQISPGPGGFGSTLSLAGNGEYVAIGSFSGNDTYVPSVFVYNRANTSWSQQANIALGANTTADWAQSLSINNDGNYLVVGCPSANSNYGKIYIYNRSNVTWTLQSTIDGVSNLYNTGACVSIDGTGTFMAYSEPNFDIVGANNTGRVQIMKRNVNTWSSSQTLYSPAGNITNQQFGTSLKLDKNGNTLIIGGYYYTRSGNTFTYVSSTGSGSNLQTVSQSENANYIISKSNSLPIIRTYKRNNTAFQAEQGLTNNSSLIFSNASINQTGNIIIGGSSSDDTYGNNTGAVYIYKLV